MKFSTENLGTWFYFNEDNEDDGGVCIRILSLAETTALDKKFKKTRIEYKRSNRFEVPVLDEEGYDKAMWDTVITDWSNVCDSEDKPRECTKDNKYDLMTRSVAFATFVTEKTEALSKLGISDAEDLAKN
jgi:hypothetical protein